MFPSSAGTNSPEVHKSRSSDFLDLRPCLRANRTTAGRVLNAFIFRNTTHVSGSKSTARVGLWHGARWDKVHLLGSRCSTEAGSETWFREKQPPLVPLTRISNDALTSEFQWFLLRPAGGGSVWDLTGFWDVGPRCPDRKTCSVPYYLLHYRGTVAANLPLTVLLI